MLSSNRGKLYDGRPRMRMIFDRERMLPLKYTVAVVGVGETDYAADYRSPTGKAAEKGTRATDSYTRACRAFKRALDNAGLTKDDTDGLSVAGMTIERDGDRWY